MRRVLAALGAAGVGAVLSVAPAAAELTENTIGCAGRATITSDDGDTYEVDAADSEVKVPRDGSAAWEGSITTVTHNHSGQVTLAVGPFDIVVGDWGPSENGDDESSASGVEELPSILEQVPAGKYDVSGFHEGDEGRCAGHVTVEVDGSPLDTPVGIGVLGATVLAGAGLVASAVASSAKAGAA